VKALQPFGIAPGCEGKRQIAPAKKAKPAFWPPTTENLHYRGENQGEGEKNRRSASHEPEGRGDT
jgi:hypothetical protein